MRKVTLTFVGHQSDAVAQKFYTWLVDGGLEDSVIETLSDDAVEVTGIADINNDTLDVAIQSVAKESAS